MASYQARQRDPLLDTGLQAVIERRGRELIGILFVVLGGALALMLASYSATDPSWLMATDAPVQNWLGMMGASIASPLHIVIGKASWVLAVGFIAWGARFAFHAGGERLLARALFIPVSVAVVAAYVSTLVPFAGWGHDFGLGGLLGDTILGALLGLAPVGAGLGLKVLSALFGVASVVFVLAAYGVTRHEAWRFVRFLMVGFILLYSMLMTMLGKSAKGAALAARAHQEKRRAHQEHARAEQAYQAQLSEDQMLSTPQVSAGDGMFEGADQTSQTSIFRAEPTLSMGGAGQTAPVAEIAEVAPIAEAPVAQAKPGFLAGLMKRAQNITPELVENEAVANLPADATSEDRVKAKIADVIRSRVHQGKVVEAADLNPEPSLVRAEPSLTHGKGPQPLIVDTDPLVESIDDFNASYDDTQVHPVDMGAIPPFVPAPPRPVVQHPAVDPIKPSRQAKAEAQPKLQFEAPSSVKYETPPLGLLASPESVERHMLSDDALEENARMLENVLDDYGVKGEIVSVRPGPVVTMYELEPAAGLKASRVIGLADDIARSMSALSARVSTVPGRSVIGIELPNEKREKVVLREILSSRDFGDSSMRLPLALGKDIGGEPIVANLAKMPHLLIAGTTGSGKSVAINTMILSLLYRLSPEECRLIMVDPKMLELSVYDGIPHLLSPVVTDPKKAVVALKWVVGEMEERYRKMSKMGVRNIEGYNSRVEDTLAKGEMFSRTIQTGFDDETGEPVFETEETMPERLPYIVVVVDEMADLMMVAGKEIEACIQRLAQMARASGIHLIMATQRPSVDVITGTIKANFPTRISFQVTSKIDSRTILGEMGAEQLLGMGDMLYMAGGGKVTRIHGPFCSDEEVEEIVNHLKSFGPPEYVGGVVDGPDGDKEGDIDLVLGLGGNTTGEDALYDQAVAIVAKDRKCSTSYIQRKLAIGYNKAARLVEQMEDEGLVSAANHVGKREILLPEH
ncbi:MAG: DNA translocase FtsK [Halocynthiibacter sp.]